MVFHSSLPPMIRNDTQGRFELSEKRGA
jgi:hypothetical protein